MSQSSDLIDAALAAANATVTSLQKLQVDAAVSDAAVATQTQHAADAATQAKNDSDAVTTAADAITADLAAVQTSQAAQATALEKLATLTPTTAPAANP